MSLYKKNERSRRHQTPDKKLIFYFLLQHNEQIIIIYIYMYAVGLKHET